MASRVIEHETHICEYILTSDGHIGIVVGESKTQIHCTMDWMDSLCVDRKGNRVVRTISFMRMSGRQVGTPSRSFNWHPELCSQ